MAFRWDWGQIASTTVFVGLFGCGLVFLHSGMQGSLGLTALNEAKAQALQLEAERDRLMAERTALQNRVMRLDERYLDLDLLDERARDVLGLIREDELVVP